MGTVYLARDRKLDRPVALKVLPEEVAAQAGLRERFVRETRMAAGFSHPNIVPVYAIEESASVLAYAMAYIEGESLAERVKRSGPLTIRETVKLLQDVGYALAYAHGRGVVHRDIKPDNIMIERATGRAMVMDFGIARAITGAAPAAQGLTRVGEVVGTPEYMSPEQATGDTVDGRSDLYALGLTAFFALTGRPAITGDTTGKVLARQITEQLAPMQSVRSDVPTALATAIDRCVMKDPAERFQTGEQLVETLDASKLSGAEIPLAIRMLQHELSSLSMVIAFVVLISFVVLSAKDRGGDASLLIVVMTSVVLTRASQAMREIGRLAASGFGPMEIIDGIRAVMAERDQRRMELAQDEAVRRARKRTMISAAFQLMVAIGLFYWAMQYRFPKPNGNGYYIEWPGGLLVLSSLILFGVSFALLLRSPFRGSPGERAFRMFWLGPVGRAFVRVSGRGTWKRSGVPARATFSPSRAPTPAPTPTPTPTPTLTPIHAQLVALERRVADLEQWKKETR